MSNEVTTPKSSNALAALQSLRQNAAHVAARLPENTGQPYCKFTQSGEWIFGTDDNLLPLGTEVIVNVTEVQEGFTCWPHEDNPNRKPLGDRLYRVFHGEDPTTQQLEKIEDPVIHQVVPWKRQAQIPIKILSGKHKGNEVLCKQDSNGFLQMYDKLIRDVSARAMEHEGDFLYPICELQGSGYEPKNKSRGKWTHIPVMEIVGWANQDGVEEESDEGEPEKLAAPEPEPQTEPEPAPEPEQAEQTPPRRRRRA